MFKAPVKKNSFSVAFGILELIYHATVRQLRKSHGSPVIGLLMNILQSMLFVAGFYAMFHFTGMRSAAVRGDFLLYVMSGIFLFMTHNKAMGAVAGAEGPTSPMMQHAPMNTVVTITSAALASLYIQALSMAVILGLYYCLGDGFTIFDPLGVAGMVFLSWLSGIGVGMIFLAATPWNPALIGVLKTIYARLNMIASGKFFLANTLPSAMLLMFTWNPLFHTIDQARGDMFINYNPHYSSAWYPLYVSLALIMIGLMWEFTTRRAVSLSWSAGR